MGNFCSFLASFAKSFHPMSVAAGSAVTVIIIAFLADYPDWHTYEIITMVSTGVIAAFTILLSIINYQLRIDQGEQAIKPVVSFFHSARTGGMVAIHLKNLHRAPAFNIKIDISDATGIDITSIDGKYLNDYMRKKILAIPMLKEPTSVLVPEGNLFLKNFCDATEYECKLKQHLEQEHNINYDSSEGLHIWHYKSKVKIHFENINGKKYSTKYYLDFDLPQVRDS